MRILAGLIFFLAAACASEGDDGPAMGETGGMCGGIAGVECAAEGDYCAMEPGVCLRVADAAGVCRAKPEICTQEYHPVCGCDGQTYSNSCVAAVAGVNVAHGGMCRVVQD